MTKKTLKALSIGAGGCVAVLYMAASQAIPACPSSGLLSALPSSCTIDSEVFSDFSFTNTPLSTRAAFVVSAANGDVTVSFTHGGSDYARGPANIFDFTVTMMSGATIATHTIAQDVTTLTPPVKTTDTVTGNMSGTQTIDLTNAGGGSVLGKGDTTEMVSISARQPGASQLNSLSVTFGKAGAPSVPEPMSLSLFVAGLAGLALARRRRA